MILFKSWTRVAGMIGFSILCSVASQGIAQAQAGGSPTAGPQFQYAALTGTGKLITLTRVPVMTSSGQVVYQDITLQFDNDGSGNLALTSGFPMFAPSPNLLVS